MWIRTTQDAEPTFHPCLPDGDGWWTGHLPMHNPVMHYRFLVVQGTVQTWLTGAGLFDHDVPDAFDFRLSTYAAGPDWALDGVVYQIFPDRFARSAAADGRATPAWALPAAWTDPVVFEPDDPRTPLQLYGGDLDGVTEHLDHSSDVGATIVYTTPVFPGESPTTATTRSTFDQRRPAARRRRGATPGWSTPCTRAAGGCWATSPPTTPATPTSGSWRARADADESRARLLLLRRRRHLRELDGPRHAAQDQPRQPRRCRHAMVEGPDSVVARWLRPPYAVDGWRIDVANMTGRLRDIDVDHEVAARPCARTAADPARRRLGDRRAQPRCLRRRRRRRLARHHELLRLLLAGVGVAACRRDSPARSFGTPVPVAQRDRPAGGRLDADVAGTARLAGVSGSWNILGSHDSSRIRTLVGSPDRHHVAAGLQFTMPGVPMVFAGDELGLEGVTGEDARRTMPWQKKRWDRTLDVYADLAALRRDHVALRRGGLRWAHVDDDQLVFRREHPEGSVQVAARRSAGRPYPSDRRAAAPGGQRRHGVLHRAPGL